jgi:hypothetical protein
MIPVEWNDAEVLEFMLVRDLLACCFGGAPQPDEWVQVRMAKGKGAHYYPFAPVIVHGRLEIEGLPDLDATRQVVTEWWPRRCARRTERPVSRSRDTPPGSR